MTTPTAPTTRHTRDRPNLVVICTDTQRCDTLGTYGSRTGVTPHLDAFAENALVFDEAYTASPVCGPARCSLLTGLHPQSHGAIENGFERHRDIATLPDLLADRGYRCMMAGKTHFGDVPETFTRYMETPPVRDVGSYPNADARVVGEAISWLETQRADEPFFLFVSLHMPHEPYQPTDDAVSRVDPATLPPLNWQPGDLDTQPRYLRDDLGIPTSPRETDAFFPNGEADRAAIDAERCRYHALCGMLDEQVGRLLATLRQRGLDDNAAVVFTSDHGTALFDHGFRDKHSFHDPVWRVPMLIRPPGRFTPCRVAGPMSWVDLTATLLGWAGADTTQMQGFDLSEILNDAGGRWPRNAVAASVFHTVALATRRWKIEFDLWRSAGRLFDRDADPLERNDLWSDDARRAVRDRLLNALLGWHGSLHSPQLDHLHLGRGGPVADNARRAQSARPANAADVQLQHATAELARADG